MPTETGRRLIGLISVMLTNLVLCFAVGQSPSISVPMGFYSLEELGNVISKQNVAVSVAPSCGKEMYAIRLDGVPWDKARAALQRDERLSITETKHGWQIERSVVFKRDETRARDNYSTYVFSTVHNFFAEVAKEAVALQPQSDDVRMAVVDKMRLDARKDPIKADAAQQLYLYSAEHDMSFSELTFPAVLTDPSVGAPGHAISTNLFEARYQLDPDGDLSKLPYKPAAGSLTTLEDFARRIHLMLKLVWDPVTLTMGYRMAMFEDPMRANPVGFTPIVFVPNRYRLTVPLDAITSQASRTALDLRVKASIAAASKPPLQAEGHLTGRAVRAGEALLKAADAAKANLIYYVSPLTDYRLPASDGYSIAKVVSDVNAGQTDPSELSSGLAERLGTRESGQAKQALKIPATYTATFDDDICVVRNELRFLDGLIDSSAALSTTIYNGRLNGTDPKLTDVARDIMKSSPSGGVPSEMLDFCNPVSFRPFAAALEASPALVKACSALPAGKSVTLDSSTLDTAALNSMTSEALRCAEFCDATQTFSYDPMVLPLVLRRFGAKEMTLQVTRGTNGFSFALFHLRDALWRSTIQNVSS
jgi:hypothetical protein